jgi:hypothetical protein
MSSIEPLGMLFNLGRNASGGSNRFSLRDYDGAAFFVDTPASASTLTITEANAGTGGTSQALAGGAAGSITGYWTQTSGVWTRVTTGISANVITLTGTPDLLYVWISQGALSDGFQYVSASHSAKVTQAVLSPVDIQRRPSNLRNFLS